ncbi:MAG: threonine/serine dehydratase [Pseudomonadales bacterium]
MARSLDLPDLAAVHRAARRIASCVQRTPVFRSRTLDALCGCELYFKCENLQRSGSFKMRGASSAVTARLAEARAHGVVTHSSGNHGAALALVGQLLGVQVTVIVPDIAPLAKREAIARYGARIVPCGPALEDREAALSAVLAESAAAAAPLYVAPYDDCEVIAGQGTAALELLAEVPQLDEIWVPVGGGGLASGTVLVGAAAGIQVRGAEPALADDAYRSLASGRRQPAVPPRTAADGLRTALGERNFEILRRYALPICLVTEADLLAAQRLVWSCLKLVIEPSSAVPLAALLSAGSEAGAERSTRRVGVILSGGNVGFPVQP